MLSEENNELLTRVGPGTAMGALLRQYWIPALMSKELPERDGRPLRVRLLGEPLVAFRDSDGKVGLLSEFCPHRRVSLYYGRNEERGLRCVYHGWKFDVTGRCVDLPSEPPESKLCAKMRTTAYRCEERGGVIWAYMGPGEAPGLPQFEWALVPEQNRYMSKRMLECNWAQALEGDIDSSHASFLHAMLHPEEFAVREGKDEVMYCARDRFPRYEVLDTDYGLLLAARRNADENNFHWRVAQFFMPFSVMVAPFDDQLPHGNIWVPMDDTHTMVWVVNWHHERPLTADERARRDSNLYFHCADFEAPTPEAGSAWRPRHNVSNNYGFDEALQRESMFFGVKPLWCQDKAVQESMGPIVSREGEHLAPSDLGIARWRQKMLGSARGLQAGKPVSGRDPAGHRVRPVGMVLPRGAEWQREVRERMTIRPSDQSTGVERAHA